MKQGEQQASAATGRLLEKKAVEDERKRLKDLERKVAIEKIEKLKGLNNLIEAKAKVAVVQATPDVPSTSDVKKKKKSSYKSLLKLASTMDSSDMGLIKKTAEPTRPVALHQTGVKISSTPQASSSLPRTLPKPSNFQGATKSNMIFSKKFSVHKTKPATKLPEMIQVNTKKRYIFQRLI